MPSYSKKYDFSVVIPVFNEAGTIREVILRILHCIPRERYNYEIIVVDNNSDDGTPDMVYNLPVKLYYEKRQGKGCAIQKGIEKAESDIIVMIDGDGEYDETKLTEMVDCLRSGYDMVVGVRNCYPYSIKLTSFIANKVIIFVVKKLFHSELLDIFSGQRAFRKGLFDIETSDFRIETEITLKALKRKLRIKEISVSYKPRTEGKKIGLSDFIKILILVFKEYLKNGACYESCGQADTEV